jgi:predicted RNA-binding protein YlxR (DUF448 family)
MGSIMGKKQQPRRKHIPQRTCVICREKKDKRTLTRIVRTLDNGIQIDPTGKMNGRGAYLCDNVECWQKAATTDRLAQALRTELSQIDRERIEAAMPH